jgi:hypothetical protein
VPRVKGKKEASKARCDMGQGHMITDIELHSSALLGFPFIPSC